MLQSTIAYLTEKLPEIRRMVAEGVGRQEICDRLSCSHPTLRMFLKAQGIVLDRPAQDVRGAIHPGTWNKFKPNDTHATPFTHDELKYRSMDEHSPEELAAIKVRLIARMPATPKRRRRRTADEMTYDW